MKRLLYLTFAIIMAVGLTFTGSTGFASAAEDDELLVNGGFETSIWGEGGAWTVKADSWDNVPLSNDNDAAKSYKVSGERSLNFWSQAANTIEATQDVALQPGSYELTGKFSGGSASPSLVVYANGSEVKSQAVTLTGWGTWDEGSLTLDVSEAGTFTIAVKLSCQAGGWGYVDDISLKAAGSQPEPEEEVGQKVTIAPIENLSEDFMRGVDVSSVISLENAGVKFYNQKGQEEDFFKILADSGVNYVRVRVWNDPYDSEGNSYGGGVCDLDVCKEIGSRAAEYGIKTLVCFHYSDLWASPQVQEPPKAWKGKTVDEITQLFYSYTLDSLNELKDAGVDIGMVQVGNETSNKLCGVTGDWDTITTWLASGCKAVRDFDSDVKLMIHFGGSATDKYVGFVDTLLKKGLDFDVVGISYYAFYGHGTVSNLVKNMNTLVEKYGKEVVVAENSYAINFEDSDGHPNIFGDNYYIKYESKMLWPVSVQGQAEQVRDIIAAISGVKNNGGIGYFYWEPA